MQPTFRDLGVPADLCDALAQEGIAEPFPVQAATLPDALAGRDLCGRAPTGSGKTLAFGIPLVDPRRQGRARPAHRPRARARPASWPPRCSGELVPLAPCGRTRLRAVYGGVGYRPAGRRSLQRASTSSSPARAASPTSSTRAACDLDRVEVVVIDEADRMADMGFLPEVRKLLDRTPDVPPDAALFSATLDGDVDLLVRNYQRDPRPPRARPRAGGRRRWSTTSATSTRSPRSGSPPACCAATARPSSSAAPSTAPTGWPSSSPPPVCPRPPSTATAPRPSASGPSRRSAPATWPPSSPPTSPPAASTSTRVPLVVHFDPADDHKDYVHRSGRTGRAGATGVVVSLVTDDVKRKTIELQRRLGLPQGLSQVDTSSASAEAPAAAPRPAVPAERPARADDGVRATTPDWSPRPNRNRAPPAPAARHRRCVGGAQRLAPGAHHPSALTLGGCLPLGGIPGRLAACR